MAGNDLTNAGFLDGTTGWSAVSGALTIDESVRGGAGRAVLVSDSGAISAGVAVTAGQAIEAAGFYADVGGEAELAVVINQGGASERLPLPRRRPGSGQARAGAPETFAAAYGLVTASLTGAACLVVTGAGGVFLTKPFLSVGAPPRDAYVWDPGVTDHPDLSAYRRWPAHLPPILLEGYGAQGTPIREGWEPDGKREITTRIAGREAVKMTGRLRVTRAEYSDLQAFCRASEDPFFFVRPETAELCLATWLKDGAPEAEPIGTGDLYATIGLQLTVI